MNMKFTFAILMFVQLFSNIESCTCMAKHPQTAFCRADFVIKAVVISDRQTKVMEGSQILKQLGIAPPVFAHYDVLVTKVFKGTHLIKNVTSNNLGALFKVPVHTSQSGAQCGVTLTNGKKYLISGRIFKRQLQINHCDWIKEFSDLTKQVKHGIHGNFDCSCQVATCVDGYCDQIEGCKWNVMWNHPVDECTQNYRTCKTVDSKCQWSTQNTDFNNCNSLKAVEALLYNKK